MKKVLLGIAMLLCLCTTRPAVAGEVDILIDKLVEKGVLSSSDAREILQEVKQAARQERARVVKETAEAIRKDSPAMIAGLPDWIANTKFKGDFRLRYQFNDRHDTPDRHRGRYRLRLGFVTALSDKVEIGFGLATGGSNPRSVHQTMADSFDTPDIRLDYAYAAYRPNEWLRIIGGKFHNPLWLTWGMLWDSDIRPEGVSVLIDYRLNESMQLFMNTGFWIIDERNNDEEDPVMFVFQPGFKLALGDSAYWKQAATVYEFRNVEGNMLDWSAGSNTLDRNGVLRHDYDVVGLSTEFGFKSPLDLVPFAAVFGDYYTNRQVSSDDDAWCVGLTFGDRKVVKFGQWQFKTMYRHLERDAWLDTFPNGSAYSGSTNVRGWRVDFQYGLAKNIYYVSRNYFHERINGRTQSENRFDNEINFKF